MCEGRRGSGTRSRPSRIHQGTNPGALTLLLQASVSRPSLGNPTGASWIERGESRTR
jgi:hypothetical protein